ncbi:homeobox protein knotted-1-like LET12 isoform X3 [Nicotiana tabacum]|uniref:Class 2 knotted1-like protein n=1 Tax=Nicotiana tabacum TaxID=4097 RepID=A9CR84_TOBAC|nr:homeobox protein knotted-1-like LET12 [Nicotiana tabacum]XP_009622164.1 homeobox protein knotted-1-like LET12 isoform X3 [Nicotiana tomentosiformis]XP_016460922.1 PREDICTED: homeobox protein knotted-1-like LET12 isoform X3 [Nicotiana tabacum]XP_016460923.1 PREDICTED: homeobox protein knotted-1-like LET12 isoform X3 [Nicotiana tabacum]BAF95776.1 class 2 knotted1-like protein [Nicotiana tabacum]
MAFQDHFSQEMATLHQQQQNAAVLRSMLPEDHQSPRKSPPTWLNTSLLRQHSSAAAVSAAGGNGNNFLHLQTSNSDSSNSNNQWLSPTAAASAGGGGGGGEEHNDVNTNNNSNSNNNNEEGENSWEREKCKADILNHPLYDQLLSAHVSCLRIATPVDQLPRIDAQLAQSQNVVAKYSVLGQGQPLLDDKDLDQFMTHYVLLLSSFKEQLQQHVRVHAMEAVMACWELEQSLQSLTGVAPGEGTGATMSDDDDDQADSDTNFLEGGFDGSDSMGFGPLVPTESERSLMERVRQELKHELKQGYKEKIVDIREEILRKRRAGKLPGDTTSVLKAWWQSHSKWPYPTEEDKARLVQETGLQLKQINNWFINQRKRNWHSNPSTSTSQKSKRKR